MKNLNIKLPSKKLLTGIGVVTATCIAGVVTTIAGNRRKKRKFVDAKKLYPEEVNGDGCDSAYYEGYVE